MYCIYCSSDTKKLSILPYNFAHLYSDGEGDSKKPNIVQLYILLKGRYTTDCCIKLYKNTNTRGGGGIIKTKLLQVH